MKKIILVFLFILPKLALSLSCEEVREELIVVENKLMNAKVQNCKGCRSKLEIEKEYNKAMAELIIAEGIFALSNIIEGNHNELIDISPDKVTEAKTLMTDFSDALAKSEILSDALKISDDKSKYFHLYDGDNKFELENHLFSICDPSVGSDKGSNLCKSLSDLKQNNKSVHDDVIESLSAMLATDNYIDEYDVRKKQDKLNKIRLEKSDRYHKYTDHLKISINGSEKLSPTEFKESEQYKKILIPLQNLLKNFDPKSNDQKKEIVDLSKKLEAISLNYNARIGNKENQTEKNVLNYLDENIVTNLDRLDMPHLLMSSPIQKNFSRGNGNIKAHLSRYESSINSSIKNALRNIKSTKIEGRSIESMCNGAYNINCLDKVCGVEIGKTKHSCDTKELQGLGLNTEFNKVKDFKLQKSQLFELQSAEKCFQDKGLENKKTCLQSYASNLNKNPTEASIKNLRKGVKDLEVELISINMSEPYESLNKIKSIALETLNSLKCRNKDQSDLIKCGEVSSGIGQQEYLNLATSGEEIIIELNTNNLKKYASSDVPLQVKQKEIEEFKQNCRGKTDLMREHKNLCTLYFNKDIHQEKLAKRSRKQNIDFDQIIRQRAEEEPDYFWDGLKVFGSSMLGQTPYLVQTWAQYDNVKQWRNNQISSIQTYDKAYMANLEAQREFLATDPATFTNFGFNFTQSSASANTSFQANNSNLVFNNFDTTAFGFTTIPATQTGTTTNSGSTSSGGGSTNFSFGF